MAAQVANGSCTVLSPARDEAYPSPEYREPEMATVQTSYCLLGLSRREMAVWVSNALQKTLKDIAVAPPSLIIETKIG